MVLGGYKVGTGRHYPDLSFQDRPEPRNPGNEESLRDEHEGDLDVANLT